MHAILVQATPMDADGDDYGIECSECGPIEVVTQPEAKAACTGHMETHGATGVIETQVTPPV